MVNVSLMELSGVVATNIAGLAALSLQPPFLPQGGSESPGIVEQPIFHICVNSSSTSCREEQTNHADGKSQVPTPI
jgi:hypothetical protein